MTQSPLSTIRGGNSPLFQSPHYDRSKLTAMSRDEPQEQYGTASLEPAGCAIAGAYGTWQLSYTVGASGIAAGGAIRIYTESDTDWAVPQLTDPSQAEFMTVDAPPGVLLDVLVEEIKSVRLRVRGRCLRQGETVTVTYGDRSGGGPGSRAQTFLETKRYFWVAVDAAGDGTFTTLANSPYLTIVGGEAVKLVAVAPSTVVAGEPFRLLVRAEDRWGNPAHAYAAMVELSGEGIHVPESDRHLTFQAGDHGVRVIEGCIASNAGTHRIYVKDVQRGFIARSNPILSAEHRPEHNLYWADPHGGQVALAAKIPDFFQFARDVAGLDFVGYQRNDHMVSAEDWRLQQEAEAAFSDPGRFVPLPGFEWSPETARGGHHNVYFRRHDQPIRRNSHAQVADKSDLDTDLTHVRDLYAAYRHSDVLITPHVGGAHADLTYHEPTIEPAIEITSTHGSFEWFLEEALQHRYTVGFVGGSDSHTGRPGSDTPGYQPRRYAQAGLTGIYASDLTLEAFFTALKARRCYATTGARIVVRVDADGHAMGAAYSTSTSPTIAVSITGTAPLESVELYRGLEKIYSHPIEATPDPERVRILWHGASRKSSYSGVVWDGTATLTNATLTAANTIRFDSPRSYLSDITDRSLKWHSVACGYRSGIILKLERSADSVLNLAASTALISRPGFGAYGAAGPQLLAYAPAESLAFGVPLRELEAGPMEYAIGALDRKVTISLARQDAPESTAFTFADPSPQPGVNPYWVRVIQSDMEMAWSSPVFVDFVG